MKEKIINYIKKVNLFRDKINSNIIMKNCIINFLFMIFFLLLGPIYEENDDVGIERIASGYDSEPSSYLVFSNILFGKILSTLYKLIPSVKWYVLLMYTLIFISFSIVSIVCDMVISNNTLSCILKYPFIIIFGFELYCRPQFTKTAGIAAMAGGSLLICTLLNIILNNYNNIKKKYISILVAISMLWIGSIIRIESFLLIIPFILIALSSGIIKYRMYKKINKHLIFELSIIGVIIAIVIIGSYSLNNYMYSNDESWNSYQIWNILRGNIVDFNTPDYYEYKDRYNEIGMSENDYYMLKNWAFGDVDFYTKDRLEAVLNIAEASKSSNTDIINTLLMSLKQMLFGLSGRLFLYILFVWLVADKRTIIDSVCVLALMAFIIFYACYFGSVGRILNRANVVVFLGAFLVLVYCMDDATLKIENNNKIPLIIVGFVMTMLSNMFFDNVNDYNSLQDSEKVYKERTLAIASDSDVTYINDVSQNIFEHAWCGVFDQIPQNVRFNNVISMGGWDINSPLWKNTMYSRGITNIFRDSVDNEKVMIITNESRKTNIETYINEHYNPLAKLNKVIEYQDGIGYYNVITKPDYNAFDPSNTIFSSNLDNIVHFVRAMDNGDKYYIDGTVYKTGVSSYEQEVFLVCENGISMNVTKKESQERDDDYNGKYGNFSVEVDKDKIDNSLENVYFVLVSGENTYKIELDEVI